MVNVLITRRIPAAAGYLRAAGCTVTEWPHENRAMPHAEIVKQAANVDGILCMLSDTIDKTVLRQSDRLRVVSTLSVGYDHVDVAEATARGVRVGHTPGVLSNACAELTVGLLLAVSRRIVESSRSAADGTWGTWSLYGYSGGPLRGKTVGIVGLGGIGASVASILAGGFGCSVLYSGPREKPDVAATIPGGARHVPFEELLARSDVVSAHCPATPETAGLFNAEAFALMKPSAFFVNTTRGSLVVQEDLAAALRGGTIAGAGLDVTSPEPLPPSHDLYTIPNLVVLPHIASADTPTRDAMLDMSLENLRCGLEGTPLQACAN